MVFTVLASNALLDHENPIPKSATRDPQSTPKRIPERQGSAQESPGSLLEAAQKRPKRTLGRPEDVLGWSEGSLAFILELWRPVFLSFSSPQALQPPLFSLFSPLSPSLSSSLLSPRTYDLGRKVKHPRRQRHKETRNQGTKGPAGCAEHFNPPPPGAGRVRRLPASASVACIEVFNTDGPRTLRL